MLCFNIVKIINFNFTEKIIKIFTLIITKIVSIYFYFNQLNKSEQILSMK